MRRLSDGLRKSAVIVCLLTVAGFETAGLKFRELGPRLRALPVFARMDPDEARVHGSGFAFDRRYGEFLESVRLAVPPTATVALDAPAAQLYGYAAAYVLAPRRVVPFARLAEADFVASFGNARPAPGTPPAAPIRFGSLGRLR